MPCLSCLAEASDDPPVLRRGHPPTTAFQRQCRTLAHSLSPVLALPSPVAASPWKLGERGTRCWSADTWPDNYEDHICLSRLLLSLPLLVGTLFSLVGTTGGDARGRVPRGKAQCPRARCASQHWSCHPASSLGHRFLSLHGSCIALLPSGSWPTTLCTKPSKYVLRLLA